MSDAPHLVLTSPDGRAQSISLTSGTSWDIGRAGSSKIALPDEAASRLHAIVQRSELDEFYLIDAGSRNGTFLNGRRVTTPALLKHGDEIAIGGHRLQFRNSSMNAASEAESVEERFLRTRAVFAEHLVTVLVIDITGFTILTQQIERELLCSFVSRWFADASGIFRAHGSAALKFIGDAVMAVWLHEPAEDHRGGVLAVLESVVELAGVSRAERYSLPVDLKFCAGLNSGLASVGNAGGSGQNDFTAFGEVVNAAFRIEASTRQIGCDVAIGARTIELLAASDLAGQFLRERTVTLKGYAEPAIVRAGSFADIRNLVSAVDQMHQPAASDDGRD